VKKITRRKFLSGIIMLFCSAAASPGITESPGRRSSRLKGIERTSRKKADHYRELAG
jgi:hypothetical protein